MNEYDADQAAREAYAAEHRDNAELATGLARAGALSNELLLLNIRTRRSYHRSAW